MTNPSRTRSWRWIAGALGGFALICGAVLFSLDRLDWAYPPPLDNGAEMSREVLDRDGKLLRAYTTGTGVWRLPVMLEAVDPDAEADRGLEDRGGIRVDVVVDLHDDEDLQENVHRHLGPA